MQNLAVNPADHVRLAHATAIAFLRRYPHLKHEEDDIHGEAMIGLMKACRLFNADYGCAFSTYAGVAIFRHLGRVYFQDKFTAKRFCRQKMQSLDSPFGHADDSGSFASLAEFVADPRDDTERSDRVDAQWSIIAPLLRRLDAKKKEIVRLIYWESLTLEETANRIGISRERVRQLELDALWKMGMPFDKKPTLYQEGPSMTDRERLVGRRVRRDPGRKAKTMAAMAEIGCVTHGAALPRLQAIGLAVTQPTYDKYREELFPGQTPARMHSPRPTYKTA